MRLKGVSIIFFNENNFHPNKLPSLNPQKMLNTRENRFSSSLKKPSPPFPHGNCYEANTAEHINLICKECKKIMDYKPKVSLELRKKRDQFRIFAENKFILS